MSNPGELVGVEYEAESTFGEAVNTYGTHRIPCRNGVDTSGLRHDKQDPQLVTQYRNDGMLWVLMTMGGSFDTTIDLGGHGSTTSGATTIDPVETWLGLVFGAAAVSAAAGTTLTGGTATVPTTTASGTFTAGSLCRIGALNDARGNGQFYPIATHVTTSLTLLAAMDGAPQNGDVLYSATNVSITENPTAAANTFTGVRFQILTANMRYRCHGCYPTAVQFTGLSPKGRPQLKITWAVSWWEYSTATFPSTLASNAYNPAPVASGSLFVNTVGTATRTTGQTGAKRANVRTFDLKYQLGVQEVLGPGGASPYQACIGAKRLRDVIDITWTEDADANTATPYLPSLGTGTNLVHICYTLSTTAGSAVGFYFPRCAITNVSVQMIADGQNRFTITARAYTGPTTTSDLTLSAWRMGLA